MLELHPVLFNVKHRHTGLSIASGCRWRRGWTADGAVKAVEAELAEDYQDIHVDIFARLKDSNANRTPAP